MGRKIKKMNFWVRRRSHLGVLLVGSVVILLLFFNDDASWRHNAEFEDRILLLEKQIRAANDSAAYYRARREQLLSGTEDLEQLAREEYHMQKPTEDVYLIKDEKSKQE